jgi:hypothetical protein
VQRENKNNIILMVVKAVAFACVVTGIIGVAVGISGTNTSAIQGVSLSIGAAAIIGIIAILLNVAGAVVCVLTK